MAVSPEMETLPIRERGGSCDSRGDKLHTPEKDETCKLYRSREPLLREQTDTMLREGDVQSCGAAFKLCREPQGCSF